MYVFWLAAFCIVTTILSCKKVLPDVSGINSESAKSDISTSRVKLKPNYVYTLVGNPDNFNQNDGVGDKAGFTGLSQLVADDGYLYALDQYIIRKIKISDRTVTTLAGNPLGGDSKDGLKGDATFSIPTSIALGPDGNIYVAEFLKVRKVTKQGLVTTVAGSTWGYQNGAAKTAKFRRLTSITVCEDGTIYVIDDQGQGGSSEFKIRKISPSGIVGTLASGPAAMPSSSWDIGSLSDLNGTLYAAGKGIFKISSKGAVATVKKDIRVFSNSLLALKGGGFCISSNNQIKKVSKTGNVSVFAGIPVTDRFGRPTEGPADKVDLHTPSGFTLYNNVLYMAVHPEFYGDPSFPQQFGHVIQMIVVPK